MTAALPSQIESLLPRGGHIEALRQKTEQLSGQIKIFEAAGVLPDVAQIMQGKAALEAMQNKLERLREASRMLSEAAALDSATQELQVQTQRLQEVVARLKVMLKRE